jgi:hypothetical protein
MAYGIPWLAVMPIRGGIKAKEEPRKAGTFAPVQIMKIKVPVPAVKSAVDGLSPTRIGTRIVAPNMANTC